MNNEMKRYLDEYYAGAVGLRDLLAKTKAYTGQIPRKLRGMQSRYLQGNPDLYSDQQIAQLSHYLNGFMYKGFSCDWLTEQIQGIGHTSNGDPALIQVLEYSLDIQTHSDIDAVAFSLLLDNFLIQSAAFIDFYLLYLWVFFRQAPKTKGQIKWADNVKPMLEGITEHGFGEKAKAVCQYFTDNVLADETQYKTLTIKNWGGVITDLRHKVVHRDRVMDQIGRGEQLSMLLTENWPERLREVGCARFCEDVRAEMFQLITTTATVLYGEPWLPGPAIDGIDP